jgi:hypothetical protein
MIQNHPVERKGPAVSKGKVKVAGGGGGVGFFALLGLLFIALKLTGFVDWSWWLVLLPLYGPAALLLGFLLACAVLAGMCFVAAAVLDPKSMSKWQK